MSDTDTRDQERAGRAGPAMAALVVVALAVAVAVLLIDQQIKRDIIAQALAARRLLDEARALAEGAAGGLRPDTTGTGHSSSGDSADLVDGGSPVAAEAGHDDSGSNSRTGRRASAPRRRAGGNGN